ncbi:hypothetical protein D3C75_1160810 [compost metagenome]
MRVNRLQIAPRQRPVRQQPHQLAAFEFMLAEHARQRSKSQPGTYGGIAHHKIIDGQPWLQGDFLLATIGPQQAQMHQPVCFSSAQYR